ncbi:hypothetical protein A2U01_0046052, partial [Trifolium medium]|nr:hypothetical protein [Trifolium medium]
MPIIPTSAVTEVSASMTVEQECDLVLVRYWANSTPKWTEFDAEVQN